MTEVRKIVIRNRGDAVRHLLAISSRQKAIRQPTQLVFDGWPTLHVNVKGKRYNSTLPTQLMEALLQYQAAVNRAYAATVYDASPSNLTQADRASLELTFAIKEGSTDSSAGMDGLLTKWADGLMEKLTPKQLIVTTLAIALIASGYFAFDNYLDHQKESKTAADQHEMVMAVIRQNADAMKALADFHQADVDLVRKVPDAREVTVGKRKVTSDQIAKINTKERARSVRRVVEGMYYVETVKHHEDQDRWTIELVSEKDGARIKTELLAVERAAKSISKITQALANGEPILLSLETREKNGQTISARLIAQDELGQAVASESGD